MVKISLPEYVEHPLVWPEAVEARLYQKAIAEKACQKNTMVILQTALGKTVDAAMATAHFLYNHWDMKILVMAPTRPLVFQHRDTFRKFLRVRAEHMAVLTGKVPPGYRRHVWEGERKVYFSTPQVVKNDLQNGRLSLEEFGLVFFGWVPMAFATSLDGLGSDNTLNTFNSMPINSSFDRIGAMSIL